jgi:hypothetical protein
MSATADIDSYDRQLTPASQAIAALLRREIAAALPDATSKVWHGHPVWFLRENPVVGYSQLKGGMRLLFWSGQDFPTPGLSAEGKFRAAEARYASDTDIDPAALRRWLHDARDVQWDYKNIVKRKGVLERLS